MFLTRVLLIFLGCSAVIAEEVTSTPLVVKGSTAFSSLTEAAKSGDANAQVELGDFYSSQTDGTQDAEEAFKWYQKAAKNGNIEGQRRLAKCYFEGTGVEKNDKEAFDWYAILSKHGDELGAIEHAVFLVYGIGTDPNPDEGIKILECFHQNGSAEATFKLAVIYSTGWADVPEDKKESSRYCFQAAKRGHSKAKWYCYLELLAGNNIPRDIDKAILLLKEAAADGFVLAQSRLAQYLLLGRYVRQDSREARTWAKKAADKGNADSQCTYGTCLEFGAGIEQNEELAFEYFLKAAKQESALGQRLVGQSIRNGMGVEQDLEKAFGWYKLAAQNGEQKAMFYIANCYADGHGIKSDANAAIWWFQKLCNLGDVACQSEFARRLLVGDGIPQNAAEGVKYANRAAMQGDRQAQRYLHLSYNMGHGVPRNFQQAYYWLAIASANNFQQKDATTLDNLEQKLTKEQLAAAQQAAANFTPKQEVKNTANPAPKKIATDERFAYGSGFFISTDGYFVTNFHVIDNAKEINVRVDGNIYKASVVLTDRKNDLAILKLQGNFEALHVRGSKSLRVADHVSTVGFPNIKAQGFRAKYSEGSVAALTGFNDDVGTMQISVPIQPGNSGGALVDRQGYVVGVIVSRLNKMHAIENSNFIPENVSYAVKGTALLNLIEALPDLEEKLINKAEGTQKTESDIAEYVARATGLVAIKLK